MSAGTPVPVTPPESVNIDKKREYTYIELFLILLNAYMCGVFMVVLMVFIIVTSGMLGPEYEQTFNQLIGINKTPPEEDPASEDFSLFKFKRAADIEKAKSTRDNTRSTTSNPNNTEMEEYLRKENMKPAPPKSGVKKVQKDGTRQSW